MEKIKLMLSKLLCFFRSQKVKPPIQKDLELLKDNEEFVGTDKDNEEKNKIITQPYSVKVENTNEISIENVSLIPTAISKI